MDEIEFRNLATWTEGSPYSDIVIADGFAYLAGKVAADAPLDQELGDIEYETRRCLELLRDSLKLAGLDMSDIVKVTVYMKHLQEFDSMNAVYRLFFEEGRTPARTTIGVADILFGCRIEIDCVARLRNA
ncbi:MAG TPA: RidA family protein [Aestuariivirgaceae bacterium]|jgi:reactive intermediate/imine deaminase